MSDQTANYAGRGAVKVYLINYDFIYENGVIVHGNNTTWAKDAATGTWKFIGDPVNANIGNNYGAVIENAFIEVVPIIELPLDPFAIQNSTPSLTPIAAPLSSINSLLSY